MKSSAIIIPVHNRRAITLACLRNLAADAVMDWATVIVMDDGSADGTAEAIRAEFPEVVIRRGDGSWWWTGAIAEGMRWATAEGAEHLTWLNDDCAPERGALRRLRDIAASRSALVSGSCVVPGSDFVAYGGLRRDGFSFVLLPLAPGEVQPCDAVSGNLVCLPSALVAAIGLPDGRRLPHAFGDIDYSMRAATAGWPVLIAHDVHASALPNNWENYASWLLSDIRPRRILSSAWDRRSYGYFPAQWTFFSRHWGLVGAAHAIVLLLKRPIYALVRALVPQSLLRTWFGRRSKAWRDEQRLKAAIAKAAAGKN
jgi:GT2 family glycosyltransferase